LAKLFINNFSQENNEFSDHVLSSTAEKVLEKYHWPGNVRQLENIIEETLIKVGPERHQIAPTDIKFPKDYEQKGPKKSDERKDTLTNEDEADCHRETIEEKEWFSELDREQLVKLCREIWETKGRSIHNNAYDIPSQLTIRKEHADLYVRAVLAIFYDAHKANKKIFSRTTFDEIFGFVKEKHELKNLLQNKSTGVNKSPYFPAKEGNQSFGILSDLKSDGIKLKQNGMALDVGGS
jgi:hypothetical protein